MLRRIPLLLLAALLGGCGDDEGLRGQPLPNTPPETNLTSIPLASDRADYHVSFRWRGWDKDDDVVGYEWRISDNGQDGVVDVGDTLQALLPWHYTTRTDTTFQVSAALDSFAIDMADTTLDPVSVRYWQTHTLYVRAVDGRGGKDPTPAHASFTATTLAPTLVIDFPRFSPSVTCNGAAQVLTFGWTGYDPDSESGTPTHVRYLLIPFEQPDGSCYTREEYEQTQPVRADDPAWTPWIPYDAPDQSGRLIRFPRKEVGRRFLFAVQAKDEAGAVTPVFDWGLNVKHVEVREDKLPLLYVADEHLGARTVVGTRNVRTEEIVGGQPLEIFWSALAEDYGGVIEAYRYGWNVADPEDPNDPGWAVPWGATWRRAPRRFFTEGSPNFVVQVRDNSTSLSRLMIQFQVIAIAARADQRSLLLVDDWPFGTTVAEREIEMRWDRQWDDLLRGRVLGFSNIDILDVGDEGARMGFAALNGYKSAIWFLGPSLLSYVHHELAPTRSFIFFGGYSYAFRPFNWLEIYLQRVGNVLLVGPGAMLSSVERDPPYWLYPIVFDVPNGGELGFGIETLPDGTAIYGGTQRFPYTAFCLEAMDIIRPSPAKIYGEGTGITRQKRTLECDGLQRAELSPRLLDRYPDALGELGDLHATEEREGLESVYRFQFEEFYNSNVTNRDVGLYLRDCQTPMFLLRARRDEGIVSDPATECYPVGREISVLDGVPVAMVSRAYSETKQLKGSEDFVWGFHPLAFQVQDVQNALLWILGSRWEVPVR